MPGTIQVSVLGLIDVQASSSGSSKTSTKVAMGKLEYRTLDSGDYIFPDTRLRENLIVTLLDVNGNRILQRGRNRDKNDNREWLLGRETFIQWLWKCSFENAVCSQEEDRNRIRFLRQSALRKKHEELVNGSFYTKSKSIDSDLSSLSPMQTRETVAAPSPKTNLGLSQETELKINEYKDPVSSNFIMWKPEVKDTVEKTKTQLSSSDVSSSKKLSEVKKPENVPLVKREEKDLLKRKIIPKRKSMRRNMSETSLNNVRKMISNFEVKVTKDTKIRTAKIQTDSGKDVGEKVKAQSQPETAVNLEKPEERKESFEEMEKSVCRDNRERCEDLVTVSRDESAVVIEEKSVEQSIRRSDSLSKQRRKRSSVRLKDSQLENALGSRLWIFPDEAKDLSCETDFGTRHLDLAEANLLQKKTGESTREDISERGLHRRSISKTNSNIKWKNIERSKKHKSENSAGSESSRGPAGQVMRALIVEGFAGLVFLTRQRT